MIRCFQIMADHGCKIKLYRWKIIFWTNHDSGRFRVKWIFEKFKNFENRRLNRGFWLKNRVFQVLKEKSPVKSTVSIIMVKMHCPHHAWYPPNRVCAYLKYLFLNLMLNGVGSSYWYVKRCKNHRKSYYWQKIIISDGCIDFIA